LISWSVSIQNCNLVVGTSLSLEGLSLVGNSERESSDVGIIVDKRYQFDTTQLVIYTTLLKAVTLIEEICVLITVLRKSGDQ
jgi:hypothetical protein